MSAENNASAGKTIRVQWYRSTIGQKSTLKVVVKHHHGLNNTSLDLLAWIKQVNHPNFGAFFDPGNVVYYTGKDPVVLLTSLRGRSMAPRSAPSARGGLASTRQRLPRGATCLEGKTNDPVRAGAVGVQHEHVTHPRRSSRRRPRDRAGS